MNTIHIRENAGEWELYDAKTPRKVLAKFNSYESAEGAWCAVQHCQRGTR